MTHHRGMKVFIAVLFIWCLTLGMLPAGAVEILSAAIRSSNGAVAEGASAVAPSESLLSDDGWLYRVRPDGYAEVLGYTGKAAATLTIPMSLGGTWVVSVSQNALAGITGLKCLQIPSSISEIAEQELTGITIKGYNGCAALEYAKSAGLSVINLSEFDLFDDILDLSEMRPSQFHFQGEESIRIAAPFDRLLSVGQKLYLPPSSSYPDGFPCEVIAVSYESGYALASVCELDFMSAVESYHVQDASLIPDLSGAVIYEEGVTLEASSQTRGSLSDEASLPLNFNLNFKLSENVRVTGSIGITSKYKVSVDYGWFKLNGISYSESNELNSSIRFIYTSKTDLEKEQKSKPIKIAKIPLFGQPLLKSWVEISVVFSFKGEVELRSVITSSETFTWSRKNGSSSTKNKDVKDFYINAAVECGVEGEIAFSLKLGFSRRMEIDIAKIKLAVGIKAEAKSVEESIGCFDIAVEGTLKLSVEVGLLRISVGKKDYKTSVSFGGTVFTYKFQLWSGHWEKRLDRFTDACVGDSVDSVVVNFYTGTGTLPILPCSVAVGELVPCPLLVPVRDGYAFTGWYSDIDATSHWDFENDIASEKLKPGMCELILYAGWTPTEISGSTIPESLDDIHYLQYTVVNNSEVEITGYKNNPKNLSIPSRIDDLPVTSVGWSAFWYCSSLERVFIPYGVKTIKGCAFMGCRNLKSASLSASITRIGQQAFGECYSLTDINIPESVTFIDGGVFDSCISLSNLTLPNGITNISDDLFFNSGIRNIKLPDTITRIDRRAFCGTDITSIDLPDGLITLGDDVFGGADFSYLYLPDSIKHIGIGAFSQCFKLQSIRLSKNITNIRESTFYGCTSLKNIEIPDGVTSINAGAFNNCTSLTSIVIPSSVTRIYYDEAFADEPPIFYQPKEAFYNCSNLERIVTPGGSYVETWFRQHHPSVKIVNTPETAFSVLYDTKGGTFVPSAIAQAGAVIPCPTPTSRIDYRFTGWYKDSGCTTPWLFAYDLMPSHELTLYAGWAHEPSGFSYIYEDDGVCITKYGGNSAYVNIPDTLGDESVVALGPDVFGAEVRRVSIPATVIRISDDAFRFAYDLSEIQCALQSDQYRTIDGVLYTKDGMTLVKYPGARSATYYTVPDGVTTIASNAFRDADILVFLTLPTSLAALQPRAVFRCQALSTISFQSDPLVISESALTQCGSSDAPTNLRGPIGASTLSTYADANELCYNLHGVAYMQGDAALVVYDARAGELLPEPPEPENALQILIGWSLGENGSLWNFENDVMPDHDISLYSIWKSRFMYEPVGVGVKLTGINALNMPARMTRASETAYRILIPEMIDGLPVLEIAPDAFSGISGVIIVSNKGSIAESYALSHGFPFEPLTYTLTFESNGGTHIDALELSATDNFSAPMTVRSNYVLTGWYKDAELTLLWDFEKNCMPADDLTLYAGWKKLDENVADLAFAWRDVDNGVEITTYTGKGGSVTIPDSINGIPVVGIAPFSFADNRTIQSLVTPDSLKYIGEGAFARSRLNSITLYSGLTVIGENAFVDCAELSAVSLPDGITEIGEHAFSGCASLLQITLPSSLVSLERGLLSHCPYLTTVALPQKLEVISENAFAYCKRLTSIEISTSVSRVASDAFKGCTNLSSIRVNADNLYYKAVDGVLLSRDGAALYLYPEGKQDVEYEIPAGVTYLEDNSMRSCRLHTLNLGEQLVGMGKEALMGNTFLKTLSVPTSVSFIGKDAIPHDTVIYGEKSSTAYQYALLNGQRFIDPQHGDIPVTGISAPESLSLSLGESRLLSYTLTPFNTTEQNVVWSSADPSIAAVDEQGNVVSRYPGETTVTVTAANGNSATCVVTVSRSFVQASGITLNADTLELKFAEVDQLIAQVQPLTATDRSVTWFSDNENVAVVINGMIFARKPGCTVVTAATANGISHSCVVTVTRPATLVLPDALQCIEPEAFSGSSIQAVQCPDALKTIGARAFADCQSLVMLMIPASVTSIAADALSDSANVTIVCPAGSTAHQFALANNIAYILTTE